MPWYNCLCCHCE